MAIVKGTVDRISSKKIGKGYAYSFCVDDEWYRHGFDKPKFKEGYMVRFDDDPINEYGTIDIDTVKFKKGEPKKSTKSASSTARSAGKSKGGGKSNENWDARAKYWEDKEKRDLLTSDQYNYRSAFHLAADLIKTGISTMVPKGDDMVPLLQLATPKASPAKKWEAMLVMIDQLAADLHQKFVTCGGDVKPTSDPTPDPDDDDDDIPDSTDDDDGWEDGDSDDDDNNDWDD